MSMSQSRGLGREFNIYQLKLKSSTTLREKNMLLAKEANSFRLEVLLPTGKELHMDRVQLTQQPPLLQSQLLPLIQLVPSPHPTIFLGQVLICPDWATLLLVLQ